MASKFGDCAYKEFIGLCAQRRLTDIDRTRWVDLFERAAGAAGKRLTPRKRPR